jgi:hypothetical protein
MTSTLLHNKKIKSNLVEFAFVSFIAALFLEVVNVVQKLIECISLEIEVSCSA